MPPKHSEKKAPRRPVSLECTTRNRSYGQTGENRVENTNSSPKQTDMSGASAIFSPRGAAPVSTQTLTTASPSISSNVVFTSASSVPVHSEILHSQHKQAMMSEESSEDLSSGSETELKKRAKGVISQPSRSAYNRAPQTPLFPPRDTSSQRNPSNHRPQSNTRPRVSTHEQPQACSSREPQVQQNDLTTLFSAQTEQLTQSFSSLTSSFNESIKTVVQSLQDAFKGTNSTQPSSNQELPSRPTRVAPDPTHASIVDSIGRYTATHPGPSHLNHSRVSDPPGNKYSRPSNPPIWTQQPTSWREHDQRFNNPTVQNNPPLRSSQTNGTSWPNDPPFARDHSHRVVDDPPIHFSGPPCFEPPQHTLGSGPPPHRPQTISSPSTRPTQSVTNHHEDYSDEDRNSRRGRARRSKRSSRRRSPSVSSDESDARGSSALLSQSSNQRMRNTNARTHYTRLPPFTGQEPWKVYYNRFQDVASLEGWTETERLRELLPRLQGQAGEFVYAQLNHKVRTNFRSLIKELKNRFRKVETSRTFGARFSNRNQNPGESVEEYAAELKRLYDKAHSNRDAETRCEDLLRRFLDGISDDSARFQVEYVKEPLDIDDAVYEVVNFIETKRRPNTESGDNRSRRPTRMVRDDNADEVQDGSGDEDNIRGVGYQKYGKPQSYGGNSNNRYSASGKFTRPSVPTQPSPQNPAMDHGKVMGQLQAVLAELQRTQPGQVPVSAHSGPPAYDPRGNLCFRCGRPGHYIRDCVENLGLNKNEGKEPQPQLNQTVGDIANRPMAVTSQPSQASPSSVPLN